MMNTNTVNLLYVLIQLQPYGYTYLENACCLIFLLVSIFTLLGGGYRVINLLTVNIYNNVFFKVQLCYSKKDAIKPLYQL